jgi:hypothetical protein
MSELYADTLAKVAAGRTALVARLRAIRPIAEPPALGCLAPAPERRMFLPDETCS